VRRGSDREEKIGFKKHFINWIRGWFQVAKVEKKVLQKPLVLPVVGAWAFVILLVLAVIAGLLEPGATSPGVASALIVLGVIVGLLNITGREVGLFLVAAIAFMISAGSVAGIPVIGQATAKILGNIVLAIAPATAIVAFKALYVLAKSA